MVRHRYGLNQVCVFTNRSESGDTTDDGKRCRIVRLKRADEWAQGEPEYVVDFVGGDHRFNVRECELEPVEDR